MQKAKFQELHLSDDILKAVVDMGFEEATPIQTMAIPPMLEGSDISGQAQTGTGKTAAFGIPILEKVEPKDKHVQAIILCPTRELAIQVAEELRQLGKYKRGIYSLAVYGGQPIERQLAPLARGVHIVVGTPGRVIDHIERGTLRLDSVRTVVLDEADVMLDMGFIEDIERILQRVPQERQTAFFSATMPAQFLQLTRKYQRHPKIVKVVHEALTVPAIEQVYFETTQSMKVELLSRLIDVYNPKLALVFCNTKKGVDDLAGHLQTRGYMAEPLHGDMRQASRDRVMSKFRSGQLQILIASDVAARGIDVDDVEIVVNYDLPQDEEYYVHRIGRTARAGRAGKAFAFVVGRDIYKLRDIQRYAKVHIRRQPIPTAHDVQQVRTNQVMEKIRSAIADGNLGAYTQMVEKMLVEELTSLDVAAALLKLLMNENAPAVEQGDIGDLNNTGAEHGMVRLFMNVGKFQGIKPSDIVGAIANEVGISGKLIGAIRIFDKYTFVEVPKENAKDVLRVMKDNQIKGKTINVELASPRK